MNLFPALMKFLNVVLMRISRLIAFDFRSLQKYLSNTGWLFGEKIVHIVIALFVSIWVARYLGPEEFGLFSYIISFVFIFKVVGTLGLDNIVIKELVGATSAEKNEILGTAFLLKVIGSIVGTLLVLLISIGIGDDPDTIKMVVVVAAGSVFLSFNVIDFYYQSIVKSKFIVIANSIGLLVGSMVRLGLIYIEAPLIYFIYSLFIDSFIVAIAQISVYVTVGQFRLKNWRFEFPRAASLLDSSWPLILSGFFVSVYMKIDQLMLKHLLDSAAVGQYSVATRMSESMLFLPAIIVKSLYPAMIGSKQSSQAQYNKRLRVLYTFMIWLGFAVVVPLWVFSDQIIITLFGIEYTEAISVFTVTIFIVLFAFISAVHGSWLLIEGLQIYNIYYSILGLVSNVIGNIILIPKYGILGAAYSTLLAQIIPYSILVASKSTRGQMKMIVQSLIPVYLLK